MHVGSLPSGSGGFNNSLLGSFHDTTNNSTCFGMCNNAVILFFTGCCDNISPPPDGDDFITLYYNIGCFEVERAFTVLINHINTTRYTFLYPNIHH